MPGPSPYSAVEAFLDPLREAVSCVGGAHFTLTHGAHQVVGKTHAWTLNGGDPVALLGEAPFALEAIMVFEIQDQGQSMGRERFRVSTRKYQYGLLLDGKELIAAHWHPSSLVSDHMEPHWHIGSVALAPSGVFLERAHIQSPRVSLEAFIRMILEQFPVESNHDDWRQRLEATEARFIEHRSWPRRGDV